MTTEHFALRQLTDQYYEENGHLESGMDKQKDTANISRKTAVTGLS